MKKRWLGVFFALPLGVGIMIAALGYMIWRAGSDCAIALPARATNWLCGDETPPRIRIMNLGASIVQGEGGRGPTFRYYLWNQLVTAGYDVDFVGGLNRPNRGALPYLDFDPDHEGHAGLRVDEILAHVTEWARAAQPDVVLFHAGTNDLAQGQSVESTLAELDELVDRLRSVNPQIKILLAQLIPCRGAYCSADGTRELNARIPALVARKHTTTSPVIAVDQHTGFELATDLADDLHPNAAGDLKMAERWFVALERLLPSPKRKAIDDSVIGDAEKQFKYVGAWTHCAACDQHRVGWLNGTASSSVAPDAYAELRFTVTLTNTRIKLYGVKTAHAGIALVGLNDERPSSLDLYSGVDRGYAAVWRSRPLLPGQYILRVSVSGQRNPLSRGLVVGIDRVEFVE